MKLSIVVVTLLASIALLLLPLRLGAEKARDMKTSVYASVDMEIVQNQNVEFVSHIGGASEGVAVQGNYAYINLGPYLAVIDISDPSRPQIVGKSERLSGGISKIKIRGNYLYALGGNIHVFDVTNPSKPIKIGQLATFAYDINFQGSYAYVAVFRGLKIYNISSPADWIEVGSYNSPDYPMSLAVAGNYAYLGEYGGMRVINISDPINPTQAGYYSTQGQNVHGLAIKNNHAYIATQGGLHIVNLSNLSNLTQTGFSWSGGVSIVVENNYAYLASPSSGLRIFDITDVTKPTVIGIYDSPGSAKDLQVLGTYAYLADDSENLRVVDITNPSAPAEVGFYDTPGTANDLKAAGDYVYVAAGTGGLSIIGNPTNPVEVGKLNVLTGGDARGLSIKGNYIYLAATNDRLPVADISNPQNPISATHYYNPNSLPVDVEVVGDYAYIVDIVAGLRIINISNINSIQEISTYKLSADDPYKIAISGQYAYLADRSSTTSGVYIVDISNPIAPIEVGSYKFDYVRDFALSGNYAYITTMSCDADGCEGSLLILDVTNPASPVLKSTTKTVGAATAIHIRGNYAYVGSSPGIQIFNITNVNNLVEVAFYEAVNSPQALATSGNYLYVAEWFDGVSILWFVPPAFAAIPLNGGTLESAADGTSYNFPTNTFTDTVAITHTARYPGNMPDANEGLTGINHFFEIRTTYVTSGQPAQPAPGQHYNISIQYRDEDIGFTDESTLALYYWDGSQWVKESSSALNVNTNTITASPTHFSLWGVFGESQPPQYLYLPIMIR